MASKHSAFPLKEVSASEVPAILKEIAGLERSDFGGRHVETVLAARPCSGQLGYQRLTAHPIETLLGHEAVESISSGFNKSYSSLFYDLKVPIALLLQYREIKARFNP